MLVTDPTTTLGFSYSAEATTQIDAGEKRLLLLDHSDLFMQDLEHVNDL